MGEDLRDMSRKVYSRDGKPNWEDLNFGVQQRIADAQEARVRQGDRYLEIMERRTQVAEASAKDKIALLRQVRELTLDLAKLREGAERTEGYWRNAQAYGAKMERSRNGLRGVITKLKRKINRANLNSHLEAHIKLAKAGK